MLFNYFKIMVDIKKSESLIKSAIASLEPTKNILSDIYLNDLYEKTSDDIKDIKKAFNKLTVVIKYLDSTRGILNEAQDFLK